MSQQMFALAVTELGKRAEICEMPRPVPGPGEVLIQVRHSGVSIGTEMWIAHGRRRDYGDPPFINGYQAAGHIVELGTDVERFSVGDCVSVFCSGAHAQFVKASASLTHKLSGKDVPRSAALFVQPAVAANALNQAQVCAGETVLVVGQGLVGQCTAMLARLRGAYVAGTEPAPERAAIAEALCLDVLLQPGADGLPAAVKRLFPEGMDIVFESTGFQGLIDEALACCRTGGRFVFEGFYPGTITYTFALAHERQIEARYPCFIGSYRSQASVIRMIERRVLDLDPLITHTPSWRDCAELYCRLFTPERDRFNGIVIDWTTE